MSRRVSQSSGETNVIPKIDTFFGTSVKNEAKKDYIVTWVAMHIRFTREFWVSHSAAASTSEEIHFFDILQFWPLFLYALHFSYAGLHKQILRKIHDCLSCCLLIRVLRGRGGLSISSDGRFSYLIFSYQESPLNSKQGTILNRKYLALLVSWSTCH